MIHAYDDCYLPSAQTALADYFDYVINGCGIAPDLAAALLAQSPWGRQFECGNPSVVAGMSGTELAQAVLRDSFAVVDYPGSEMEIGRSPEYWAGWCLAAFQWRFASSFKDIFRKVSFSEILSWYPLYHEMGQDQFDADLVELLAERRGDANLKRIREARGLSQSALAEKAQVGLRSIQMYEQRVNDIDKAQARTLYRMARVLGCSIDDLLENPNC
ncbi:helix-turn-helix transcriptional regulator [uncultured Adlercreutzia sp.]|uniref:helix-turn-helix domain-containing protein n=1 Tax=uncultured Adlercreutzia sp. TaxID=875803 RepID=UPI0025E957F8|nr:helix-turn-helix transcriptional regulator [uncultured Adlercreutzia sp.]